MDVAMVAARVTNNKANIGCEGEIALSKPSSHPPVPTAVPTAVAAQFARAVIANLLPIGLREVLEQSSQ
jgi:hypothetical protein